MKINWKSKWIDAILVIIMITCIVIVLSQIK